MGVSSSKLVSNPSQFASPVTQAASGIQPTSKSWKSYDYIICGGGTAACVLASRLSESPEISVLLIEAGQSNKGNLLSRIPLAFTQLLNSSANWQYETVPQVGLDNKKAAWGRGKILGGSSSINASVYQRCAPENFSEWVKAGATGWDAEEMTRQNDLRYFNKAEKYEPNPNLPQIDTNLHGSSGRSSTRYGPFAPICDAIIDACVNVGIPRIPTSDMNADKGPGGVSNFAGSVDPHGERSSAATAYLTKDVLSRPNLTVAVGTLVTKIHFDDVKGDEPPRASGVLMMASKNGRLFAASARREVIVSTGTVVTPQLLMVSGIGPAEELKKHNIPVVRDLAYIGKNLLDHFSAGSLVVRAKAGNTWDSILRPIPGLVALGKWLVAGTGPMTSVAAPVGIFVHSDTIVPSPSVDAKVLELSSATSAAPDIEIFFAPLIVINNGFTKTPGFNGLTIGVSTASVQGCIALNPASQGTITLASSNMWDHPVIDPKYFSNQADLNVLIKATRLALRIARASPLSSRLDLPEDSKDQTTFFWPGDANPDTVSDDDLTSWIKRNGQTAWHPTSTAKMGSSSSTSVVDPELKVHGVAGLRVVDASVFPTQVSGHPCAVVIAVAEKAADLIKSSQ
ncbi:GMC oxidoreductase [Mycena sp. CBHHK59/15]|nr:GMC oxidoreductase [Mycena sp. CBHHK59/15]